LSDCVKAQLHRYQDVDGDDNLISWLLPWAELAIVPSRQETVEATLTAEEQRRNGRRIDLLYVSSSHPVAPDIFELADSVANNSDAPQLASIQRTLDPKITGVPPWAVQLSSMSK